MDDKQSKMRWQISLEDTGGLVPGIARLRRFLKCAIRSYGLKCVAITEEKPPELPRDATKPEKRLDSRSGASNAPDGSMHTCNAK